MKSSPISRLDAEKETTSKVEIEQWELTKLKQKIK